MRTKTMLPASAGVGYKPQHFDAIETTSTKPGFLEIHAENYMTDGGWPHRQLERLRRDHALSVHGVALSLGGAGALDGDHLRRVKILCERYEPESFSEHLAWTSHAGLYFNDLLPLPYTEERLARVVAHVDETQNVLARKILIENPATYVAYAASTIPETEFLAELVRRTGCGLLLDVNNVHVCARNHGFDARAYLQAFPFAAVEEIHLAGHEAARDAQGGAFLVDSHGAPIADAVLALYAEVLRATGPLPTLIERDDNIPEWHELEAEMLTVAVLIARAGEAPAPTGAPSMRREAAMRPDDAEFDARFAAALADPALPAPGFLTAASAHRFPVYRNNMAISLIEALEARFPAVRMAVGDEFFRAMAQAFVGERPPRRPMLNLYGDELPEFIRHFGPAADVPYLGDLAQVEIERTRAAHAADVDPLPGEALAAVEPDSLARMHVALHPSVAVVASSFPIATIWGMNSGALPLGPIAEWRPESVVVARPRRDVELHRLPPGGAVFLRVLAADENLADAASAATAAAAAFDLGLNLAALFNLGLAVRLSFEHHESD